MALRRWTVKAVIKPVLYIAVRDRFIGVQPNLSLASMHERHYGLRLKCRHTITQAVCVCLDRHHTPSVVFTLSAQEVTRSREIDIRDSQYRF